MILEQESLPYLKGDKFSKGYFFRLPSGENAFEDRISWFERHVRGKTLLDAGCADHSTQAIERKRKMGTWLHEKLRKASSFCAGVDVSTDAVHYMKNVLHLPHVFCGHLLETPQLKEYQKWDVIVLGEILEHTDNPVEFLRSILEIYPEVNELLVSVPNALRFQNFVFNLANVECINSDHRYWFTPYTLAKVCVRAGWAIGEWGLVNSVKLDSGGVQNLLKRYWLKRFPMFRDTIVARLLRL